MQCIKCKQEIPDGATFCPWCGKKQVVEPRKALKRANGTGTVYKLPGRRRKPWCAAIQNVRLGYYTTKTEAMEKLNSMSGKAISDLFNATFSEVYEQWSKEYFVKVSKQQITCYSNAYKTHAKELYNSKMRDIRTRDFQEAIDKMNSAGLSESSMEKLRQLFSQMSKWSMREEIITTDFSKFISVPKKEKKEKDIFSEEDIQTLWDNVNDETVRLILIMIYTGMRIGELFSVQKDKVAIEDGYLVGGEKTEAGRNRVIPFPDKILPFVRSMFDSAADGGLLIDGYSGNKDSNNFRKRDFYPTLEKYGIERVTPHATRHTFVTRAIKQGINLDELGRLVGHVDKDTTKLYLHDEAVTIRGIVKDIK